MALQMSQEYSGTLAKFEYSRYENNIYLIIYIMIFKLYFRFNI